MRYTWRIIITVLIMIYNGIAFSLNMSFSYLVLLAFFVNALIGWTIGYIIDRYLFSKKQLHSAKKELIDYSIALDSAAEAIGITNEKGILRFVNDTHAALHGYKKNELLNTDWKDCCTEESTDYLRQTVTPILLKNGYWRGEATGKRKDGTTFPEELSLSLIKASNDVICVIRNINDQKQYERHMSFIAEHDDLTNLPNRRRLLRDLEKCKEDSKETSLLFIDLDRFKVVNDTLGHEIGDELLKHVALRLSSFNNESTSGYHNSGDEFIVLTQDTDSKRLESLATAIVDRISQDYHIREHEICVTPSIGISTYPDHTDNIYDLIKMSDTAMYHAKLDGKNTFKFFNNDMKLKLERKAIIESELRKAIKNEELFIHYQPKFNIQRHELVGIEALIRWRHPELGLVSPAELIPIAEETGLIIEIGEWIIQEVLKQMKEWQRQGYPSVKVSVNVSQRQLRDNRLIHFIDNCLHATGIDAKYLEVEITESVMENLNLVIPKLKSLRKMGVSISIDDFGTGYSSLNFLKDLPIDTIKIDQSFIRDLFVNSKDDALVKAILQIGKALNLTVVAEGIETEEHLSHLTKLNCPIGQGYYFSKPIGADEFEACFLAPQI